MKKLLICSFLYVCYSTASTEKLEKPSSLSKMTSSTLIDGCVEGEYSTVKCAFKFETEKRPEQAILEVYTKASRIKLDKLTLTLNDKQEGTAWLDYDDLKAGVVSIVALLKIEKKDLLSESISFDFKKLCLTESMIRDATIHHVLTVKNDAMSVTQSLVIKKAETPATKAIELPDILLPPTTKDEKKENK